MSDPNGSAPVLAADGTPLKKSLARALRRQKLQAFALIAPLLLFVILTFVIPIISMLFRSVENQIVSETLPGTVEAIQEWDVSLGETPSEDVFVNLFFDLFNASEAKEHTKLGTRLNYEDTGLASMFRTTGRSVADIGEVFQDSLEDIDPQFEDGAFWYQMLNGDGGAVFLTERRARWAALTGDSFAGDIGFSPSAQMVEILPATSAAYTDFAIWTVIDGEDVVSEEDPWEAIYAGLALDLRDSDNVAQVAAYDGFGADALKAAVAAGLPDLTFTQGFAELDEEWLEPGVWETISVYSPSYTPGYFLNAVDRNLDADGIAVRPDNEQIYIKLFGRTMWMSMMITVSCILLGYPVAWLLANLPMRSANALMILVLLPFWTSLLVRTSAWKVLLQQQGVINEILVWLGFVDDANRLILMNNSTGTIIAMTHILLPFMILPLYSVMKTIQPTYLRAAKSLGATNWTAFWRVYFPQSVPGIGAGSILVFILAIGYYITPEIVGGTDGVFISNRIAYHISRSLNWGLAAALGTILLVLVLALYWLYDRIVGIDNVKLGG
ncbi:MAG: putative spermidine/putrescine transport system permease protein [Yoonia sp.]|jgi:putative spermidine/putrescine transport system permease protein